MVGSGVFAAVDAIRSDDGEDGGPIAVRRRGSTAAAGDVELVDRPVRSYRITYRLNDTTGQERTIEWAVSRPFESRSIERGDGYVRVDETAFARAGSSGTRIESSLFAVPPRAPDHRPFAVVDLAVAAGVLDQREVRVVAGQRCRVYRASGTLDRFSAPDPRSYTDTCVDQNGLVLEEWQVAAGRPTRHRIATRIELDTTAAAKAAEPKLTSGPTVPANVGGGDVREVQADSMPTGTFFVLDAAPAGFELRGRFAVVPSQPALADPSRGQAGLIASTADVFVRSDSGDFVVVDQGGTLGRTAPFEPAAAGAPADLGPELGTGEALFGWTGTEIRVARDGGRFVRVYGTVSQPELEAVAAALRRTEGGTGLVYL